MGRQHTESVSKLLDREGIARREGRTVISQHVVDERRAQTLKLVKDLYVLLETHSGHDLCTMCFQARRDVGRSYSGKHGHNFLLTRLRNPLLAVDQLPSISALDALQLQRVHADQRASLVIRGPEIHRQSLVGFMRSKHRVDVQTCERLLGLRDVVPLDSHRESKRRACRRVQRR